MQCKALNFFLGQDQKEEKNDNESSDDEDPDEKRQREKNEEKLPTGLPSDNVGFSITLEQASKDKSPVRHFLDKLPKAGLFGHLENWSNMKL